MRLFYRRVTLFVLVFFLLCYTPCFAASIAKVLSLVPGVIAERKGENIPLKVKDDIYLNDVLRSDATGKVQIIFDDDTVLTLGNNTTFSMLEYNNTDSPAFKGDVGSGFARFVTGQIVSKNPEAFKVQAPQCTIGIRGTTFAVQSTDADTVVYTENSNNQQSVTANGINVPPGSKIGFHPDGTTEGVRPMTPQDRYDISINSTISSAGDNKKAQWAARLAGSAQNLPDAAGGQPGTDLASSLNAIASSDTVQNTPNDVIVYGHGTFTRLEGPTTNIFMFEANLTSGAISDARMRAHTGPNPFDATGGRGTISGSSYSITGATGDYDGSPITNWTMSGNGLTLNGPTSGSYRIGIATNFNIENGSFTGDIANTPPEF